MSQLTSVSCSSTKSPGFLTKGSITVNPAPTVSVRYPVLDSNVASEFNIVSGGIVASALTARLLRSITTVDPYPITVKPVPTKLMSVNPAPIFVPITPDSGFIAVDPIPTPVTNNLPSLYKSPPKSISPSTNTLSSVSYTHLTLPTILRV